MYHHKIWNLLICCREIEKIYIPGGQLNKGEETKSVIAGPLSQRMKSREKRLVVAEECMLVLAKENVGNRDMSGLFTNEK